MKTIREKIEVMEAFERGERIEFTQEPIISWASAPGPNWDWSRFDYRIKPAKKMRLIEQHELPYVFETIECEGKVSHLWSCQDFTPRMIKRCADINTTFTTDGKSVRSFMVEEEA